MQIVNIRNVKSLPDGNYSCTVDLVGEDGTLEECVYAANAGDPHSDVWARIEAGDYTGEIEVVPEDTAAEVSADLAKQVRYDRTKRMDSFQWRLDRSFREEAASQTATELRQPLLDYMQALADVPDQAGFPETVTWPVEP